MTDTVALIDALTAHLAEALGAMTGTAVRTLPSVGETGVDWQVAVQVGGTAVGTVWIGLSQDGASRLVGAVLGDPSTVTSADIVDTLKELLAQSAGACVQGAGKGLDLTVETPEPASAPMSSDAQQYELIVGADAPIGLVGWGHTVQGATAEPPRAARQAPPSAAPPAPAALSVPPPRNLDVVLDIELPITVRFGETQMTLEALARLGPGSMIDLARSPDDPVDLLVNGRLVARGQVVVVSGCYGVRVNEVVSPADRLRSLEL